MSDASEFKHLGGGRKGLFLLLRYVFIAAASYLVLLQQPDLQASHALMIAVALASNVALSVVSSSLVFSWYVEAPVLIADTLWVSWALHSTGAAGQEFFLLYFFVLSLAALGESLFLVLLGSTTLSFINVYLDGWNPNNLIQVVFFYTVALFYGYVIKEIKSERQRADRGIIWVRELESKVAERTQELSHLYDALMESESRYRAVSEMMSDFAYAARLSPAGLVFEWATDSFSRITGYGIEELTDGQWEKLIHPDDLEDIQSNAERLVRKEPFVAEYRIITKDGAVRWLRAHTRPVDMEDGTTRILGAAQDITARARAEEEQRRLLEVLEATPDLVGISDPEGRVLYYNAAGRGMLGIAREGEVLNNSASDHQPPWAWQMMRSEAIPIAQREGSWQGEAAIIGADGREVPVSQVVVAHRGRDGSIAAYSTVARDITEQKQLEEILQQEVRISTAMARTGRELIAVLDASVLVDRLCRLTPELLHCDASATLMLNPDSEDAVPVGWYGGDADTISLEEFGLPDSLRSELLTALAKDEVIEVRHDDPNDPLAMPHLLETYGVKTTLFMALRRGGKLIGYHTATSLAGEEKGKASFSSEQKRIARGIAHLASLALENARLTASLEKANRLKSEFVATMSHELRTPLNVILGFNDLLRDGEYGPMTNEQKVICDRMEQSGWNLLELINSTLDLSRLEQGRLAVDYCDTNISDLLRQLRGEVEPILEHKPQVEMHWDAPPDLPEICTDPAKLKVVLKNLITNAVKFTDEGAVTVAASARNGSLEVDVSDTGQGIPSDALKSIFEPYRQVDGSTTRRHDGVGLGLHIVRRYVDLLGGDVEVESTEGHGSRFRVSIPRQPAGPRDH